jgi:hypothetical protein
MKETRKTECSEAKILRTWSGSREFRYYGSVSHGTLIDYGQASVAKLEYRKNNIATDWSIFLEKRSPLERRTTTPQREASPHGLRNP